jgi:hypothetical protein
VVLKIVSVVHGVVPSDRVHHSLVHLGPVLGSDLKLKVAFPGDSGAAGGGSINSGSNIGFSSGIGSASGSLGTCNSNILVIYTNVVRSYGTEGSMVPCIHVPCTSNTV